MKTTVRIANNTYVKADGLTAIIGHNASRDTHLEHNNPRYTAIKVNPLSFTTDDVVGVTDTFICDYQLKRAIDAKAVIVTFLKVLTDPTDEDGLRHLLLSHDYYVHMTTDYSLIWKYSPTL